MLTLEIVIDNKKLKNTKNECYELLYQKYCQDLYKSNLTFAKPYIFMAKYFIKYRKFFKTLFLLCASFLGFASFYDIYHYFFLEKQTTHLILGILFFMGMIAYFLFFKYYDKTFNNNLQKYQLKNFQKKLASMIAKTNCNGTFKSLKKQSLPFWVIYECDDNIHYYRKIENGKISIWQRPMQKFKNGYYLMGDHCCFIFNKPTSQNFQIFLWIDENNKEILETYLKNQGLEPLNYPLNL